MAQTDRSMRSPLGRVRHHGAAHEGTGHFIATRLTSIALAVLGPWFVVAAALSLRDGLYLSVLDFLAQPVNAVGVILLVVIGLYHMSLGMQDVILDYIHKPSTKIILLLINLLVPFAFAAGAIFAVLHLNFGV